MSTSHGTLNDLNVAYTEAKDPGSGAAITIKPDGWAQVIRLIIAASTAETNTLAAPTFPNQRLKFIATSVGSGGSRTITVASGLNQDADTTLVFDTQYDWCILESFPIVVSSGAMTYKWRIIASEGVGGAAPPDATFDSAAVSTADGLTVNSVIVPTTKSITVNCLLNTHCVDQCFFIADRAYQVTAIDYVHATAGTDGSAVNVQVVKDTSTDAPGAGTDLLTNNTNAGFNCKGTINTVQNGTLTGTAASLQLAAGNRLSLDFAGTVTSLAGVQVTVTLKAI